MHTIHKRLLAFHRHELCHAAVCQKHELLDKPVGLLGNLLVYIYRTALLIHLYLHLRTLETDGSGCESLLAELGCKAMKNKYGISYFLLHTLVLSLWIFNDRLSLLICKAMV